MKTRKQISHNVLCFTATAIMFVLLTSCSDALEVGEVPKDDNSVISSETNLEEKPTTIAAIQEPQDLTEKDFSEDNTLETFVNNGLKLQYPTEWSLFDVTNKRAWIKDAFAIYEIKKSEEDVNLRIVVQIYSDIPDGGFEKRKEEANQFFESAPNATAVLFDDIKINGVDFYKMDVPLQENIQETILATVKNDKRYDIYANFNKTNPNEVAIIEKIFDSIEIAD